MRSLQLLSSIITFVSIVTCKSSIDCTANNMLLDIHKKCNESYSVSLQHKDMRRSFLIYIPSTFCSDNSIKESNQLVVPILIALHCIGCAPSHELAKWQSVADDFSLLLIIPRGGADTESLLSWNAEQCCGPALSENRDDLGFITQIIHGLQCSFSTTFPLLKLSNKNQDPFIFVSGFSNGGFMADKIAWISSVGRFTKIIAAAPSAGYIYNHHKYTKDNHKLKENNIAMYFHHSSSDRGVNPDGCCTNHTEGCCCGIAQQSDICLSIHDEFENWLLWNNCNNVEMEKLSLNQNTNKQIDCYHATPEEHGCDVLTSLCLHSNVVHSSWARSFPLTNDVGTFFVKALCLSQKGIWNENDNGCECSEGSGYQGLYCITKIDEEVINLVIGEEREEDYFFQYIPETSIIMVCIVFLSIGFFMIYQKSQNEFKYSRLGLDDEEEEEPINSSIIEDIQLHQTQRLNKRAH